MVTKEQQIRLYKEELEEIELEVKSQFNTSARSLFKAGDLFICQYKGYDSVRGNIFVDIKDAEGFHTPRIDQLLNAFVLREGKVLPKQWGNDTYNDLLDGLNSDFDMSQAKLVNFAKSKREGWITLILSNISLDFMSLLEYNMIIGLGPVIPPFDYLINLMSFSENIEVGGNNAWDKLLNYSYKYDIHRQPQLLTEDIDIAGFIIEEVNKNKVFIFQGPPGTGKTHQIADVISRLAMDNKSVLVTAQTNKAAIEVCEKPFLADLMDEYRVYKTALSSTESAMYPKLAAAHELASISGQIVLTTYYKFSQYWDILEQSFDYIIVEEASQAFLTTIAAAIKLGKYVIIVGDPFQVQPIVKYKNKNSISENIDKLILGLQTICSFTDIPYYRKIETRRLTPRSTNYTNIFYQNTITSLSLYNDLNEDIKLLSFFGKYIHPNGGPTLILDVFGEYNKKPKSIIPFLIKAINEILKRKSGTVAVLSPFIDTVKFLQKELKTKTLSNKYLVDSVDKIQGLDVDFCFYVIPDDNYSFSLKENRFNVATSRAKKSSIILADTKFYRKTNLDTPAGKYLTMLLKEFCFVKEGISYSKQQIDLSTINIGINKEKRITNIDDITDKLIAKEIISIDDNYNSLIENGNVIAEAEFVFEFNNIKIAILPFSDQDKIVFMKNEYEILSLESLIKQFNL